MKRIKYQKCRVRSDFNHVIELNQKMLNLKRFVPKNDFFHIRIKKTDVEYLQKWRKEYRTSRVGSGFNRVIELNQKMLILKIFVA